MQSEKLKASEKAGDPALPFEPVPSELDFPSYEQRILDLWKERRIVESSLEYNNAAPTYIFYEGPPTANGLPHNGHVLTRVMKDLFPRYRTMTGDRVLRKGGWDTHGLPVEVEVEKELHIHGKAAIEAYGVEPFVERCIESVFRYTSEWERLTERLAFWVSLDDAYVTYHRDYVESVWWALSELFRKGLLYRGHKVVWWWAQGGTALSAAEVGLGYKTVDDPSVYLTLPLVDDPETGLVVWTTTPWTLPSNGYAAVKPECTYDVVRIAASADPAKAAAQNLTALSCSQLIVASQLKASLAEKLGVELETVRSVAGRDLVGQRYVPPFDYYARTLANARVALKAGGDTALWWRVLAADFVTLDTGTGIVHIAPAFGEDDHLAHKRELERYAEPGTVELLCAIDPNGEFKAGIDPFAGRWVKDCDREIITDLGARGLLVHTESYRHEYPYCWRADSDPLIQLARPGWFIRTTARLDQALANNQAVNWLPDHIKDGRFGDFLHNNVDWALSRERYWGTPLNVWVCGQDETHKHAPASVEEIERLNPAAFAYWQHAKAENPALNDHLMVHKPWIDQVTFPCPECGAEMRRVTEVIDCWFDSGCMPFAQFGFPHKAGSSARFNHAFPADFISEAIDQTRGWFYSLLMISSLLFDEETQRRVGLTPVRSLPHPYKTCIVLGHISDREGRKESKSRGNYTPPEIILDKVRMEFGVLSVAPGSNCAPGEVLIARADLDGMDLEEGAELIAYRADASEKRLRLVVRGDKRLPRRVALMNEADRSALGLSVVGSGLDTRPVDVPRLPDSERVTLEDPATPAPGADAFRWFFYAGSPAWSSTRHSLRNVRTLQKDFQVKLRNVYSFFTIYANIDGWRPLAASQQGRPWRERTLLDRWLLSELELTRRDVLTALDNYLAYDAAQRLVEFVESLSNWYVRRSRARFWATGLEADKCDAYATLYEALVALTHLVAPFIPFFSEEMYQNLVVRAGVQPATPSVHHARFPAARPELFDEELALETRAVRDIVSLGLSVRTAHKLKVRQPLSRVDIVFNDPALVARIEPYQELIREELNVHEVRLMATGHAEGAVTFRIKPNFRALGPRLGKGVQAVKQALSVADGGLLHAELARTGQMTLLVEGTPLLLSPAEVEVAVEAKEGFAAETGRVGVVVLHTVLTESLIEEGLLREIVSRIQGLRKEAELGFAERIELWLSGSERLCRVAEAGRAHVQAESLALALHVGESLPSDLTLRKNVKLGEEELDIGIRRQG